MNEKPTKESFFVEVVRSPGPSNRAVFRVVFIILLALGVVWVISRISGLILLLVLSIFFAYLVSPLVEFLRRPRTVGKRNLALPKIAAIALSYLVIFGAILFAIFVVVPSLSNQFPQFAEQAKEYWQSLGLKAQQLVEYSRSKRIPLPVIDALNSAVPQVRDTIFHTATDLFYSSLAYVVYLPWLVLIPILGFFLLKDAESFRRSALLMLPRGRWRWRGDEFFQDVNTTLAAYIRAQLTACLFIGVVCALGFTVLGLPGGLVMGVIAGFFEFVPLVGPLAIAVMATVLAMFHAGPFNAFLVLLFLGVLRIVQDYVIYPRLIGHGIHLHPLAVIFAILAGEKLAGVPGIFLAIPVVAIVTVSYRHWMEHRGSEGLADLLEPSPPPDESAKAAAIAALGAEGPVLDPTVEELERLRPDLTTEELKLPEG